MGQVHNYPKLPVALMRKMREEAARVGWEQLAKDIGTGKTNTRRMCEQPGMEVRPTTITKVRAWAKALDQLRAEGELDTPAVSGRSRLKPAVFKEATLAEAVGAAAPSSRAQARTVKLTTDRGVTLEGDVEDVAALLGVLNGKG